MRSMHLLLLPNILLMQLLRSKFGHLVRSHQGEQRFYNGTPKDPYPPKRLIHQCFVLTKDSLCYTKPAECRQEPSICINANTIKGKVIKFKGPIRVYQHVEVLDHPMMHRSPQLDTMFTICHQVAFCITSSSNIHSIAWRLG